MKCRVYRVYLNSQGYTSRGEYFGVGEKLYCIELEDLDHLRYYRASSRDEAKQMILRTYPQLKFYR